MGAPLGTMEPGLVGIATQGFAVTPSDTVADPAGPFRYLYVGTAGDVELVDMAGNDLIYKTVPAGGYVFVAGTRVKVASTTASHIIGHT